MGTKNMWPMGNQCISFVISQTGNSNWQNAGLPGIADSKTSDFIIFPISQT